MTVRITFEQMVALVDGDRELIATVVERGLIVDDEGGFCAEDVDRVLASRTLVREMEVNWEGVDIILRLREELARARRLLARLDED